MNLIKRIVKLIEINRLAKYCKNFESVAKGLTVAIDSEASANESIEAALKKKTSPRIWLTLIGFVLLGLFLLKNEDNLSVSLGSTPGQRENNCPPRKYTSKNTQPPASTVPPSN